MIHHNMKRMRRANKFTILLIASLLLTLVMSRPASSLVMVEYRLPLSLYYGINSRPQSIVVRGNYIFFTETGATRIGLIDATVSPHILYEYLLPTENVYGPPQPWGMANDTVSKYGDTKIWFTDISTNRIGSLAYTGSWPSPTTFSIREYQIPTSNCQPRGIYVDREGYVWFTEFQSGKIGRFIPTDSTHGTFTEWQLPDTACQPNDIMVANGTVWFTEYARDRIGMFSLGNSQLKEFILPSGSSPWSLTSSPDGTIWFTCSGRNVIGSLNNYTGDVIEHRSIPTDNSQPRGISFDPITGNVWFTEYAGHKVTKYAPDENLFYEYPTLTGGSAPLDIELRWNNGTAVDAWFTEYGANSIGQISQGRQGASQAVYGTTYTATVTTLTSAVSGTYTAGSSTTSTATTQYPTVSFELAATTSSIFPLTSTATTSAVKTETAYRLSTSTYGTYTSYIVEVAYTSITSTLTSTTYVSTESVTASTGTTSTSTSYIGTTSVTSTSTSYQTVNTGTVTRTSSTTVSVPLTLTSFVTMTSYKKTVSGSTSSTSTSTVSATSTSVVYSTVPTTTTKTVTSSRTTTTFTIPPVPSCFIASAAYGSPLSPQVQALRGFRDGLVLKTFAGSEFMKAFNAWYYSFSPSVAPIVSKSSSLALIARALIYPLIGILQLAAAAYAVFGFNPEVGVTVAGLLASSLIGIVYHTPWIAPLLIIIKKKRGFQMKLRYLVPFAGAWITCLALIGIAGFLMASTLMMMATATFVLLTLGLSATGVATLIARKVT